MQKGGKTLNYTYNPDVNLKESATIAYEYVFTNSMTRATAVNLKELDTSKVNVSYAWSSSELDTSSTITTYTDYVCQTMENTGDKLYTYIFVSPKETTIPTSFTSSVMWYYGMAKEITISNNINSTTTKQTIVNGQSIDKSTLTIPTAPEGYYFDAWFLDKNYTKLVETDEFKPGQQLYARFHNITPNTTEYIHYIDGEYIFSSDEYCENNEWRGSGYSYWNDTGITNLIIPTIYNDGVNGEAKVTGIGQYAFNDSYNEVGTHISSISLPCTINSIGSYAFSECDNLTSVTIPSSVTSVSHNVFQGCSALTNILVSSGNSVYDSRDNCNAIIETNTNTLIAGCNNSTIPSTVTSIGKQAFYQCSGLTSIDLPSSLTSIGNYAFQYCSGLTSIDLPSSLTSIGDSAFSRCSGLTSVDLSKCTSLTSIGGSAFSGCSGLTSIDLSGCSSLTSIAGFYQCSGLTSIDLPSSVTSIGGSAFQYCSGLTSIDLSKCTSLTSIGRYAFHDCSGLTSIIIPDSVTSIGDRAFYGCIVLTSITIPANVTSIGSEVFCECTDLDSIVVSSGNSVYDSRDNCNAIIESNTNTLIQGCNNSTIPSTVTSIGDSAFAYCSGLTSIDLSKCTSLTSIGSRAFYYCSGLTSISLPSSITSIGDYAFSYCSGLTSISLPSSLTSIGSRAFNGCSKLTSITIPANVIKIGAKAFQNSGLTSMTFSDTSTWYRVSSSTNWNNMTGGTSTDVTNASTNATRFKSTSGYYNYYWYKL